MEDDTSYAEHMKFIAQEMRKATPNIQQIKLRMRRTLFQRAADMARPTAAVMERFPFLGNPMLLRHEMMMRHGVDLSSNLTSKIIQAMRDKKHLKPISPTLPDNSDEAGMKSEFPLSANLTTQRPLL
ncbi:hypothetical protein ACEWY4_021492 [Coilia grayii]|uniref:Uncharacterized protein n=1 Tax=Coilia grayii TaxID=363190 RepID=A0ABD1J971_9TELE